MYVSIVPSLVGVRVAVVERCGRLGRSSGLQREKKGTVAAAARRRGASSSSRYYSEILRFFNFDRTSRSEFWSRGGLNWVRLTARNLVIQVLPLLTLGKVLNRCIHVDQPWMIEIGGTCLPIGSDPCANTGACTLEVYLHKQQTLCTRWP